jgi:hypothetical protein
VTWASRIPFAGWLWLLSGLPVGLILMWSPPPVWVAFFTFSVWLEVGDAMLSIVFAWTDGRYRRLILSNSRKYILLPGALFVRSPLRSERQRVSAGPRS